MGVFARGLVGPQDRHLRDVVHGKGDERLIEGNGHRRILCVANFGAIQGDNRRGARPTVQHRAFCYLVQRARPPLRAG
jgi:hypothetical protein